MILDREQLEILKRQIEEDYRLDISAIERLQRRFINAGASVTTMPSVASAPSPSSSFSSYTSPSPEPVPVAAGDAPQAQADELTGTLRAMFSSQRR